MRRDTTPVSAAFRQGATPPLNIMVDDNDLTQATQICVTIEQKGGREFNFMKERITVNPAVEGGTLLSIHLTQEETLSMRPIKSELQVRWRDPDNEAYTTDIVVIDIGKALYKEVLGA